MREEEGGGKRASPQCPSGCPWRPSPRALPCCQVTAGGEALSLRASPVPPHGPFTASSNHRESVQSARRQVLGGGPFRFSFTRISALCSPREAVSSSSLDLTGKYYGHQLSGKACEWVLEEEEGLFHGACGPHRMGRAGCLASGWVTACFHPRVWPLCLGTRSN